MSLDVDEVRQCIGGRVGGEMLSAALFLRKPLDRFAGRDIAFFRQKLV